MLRTIFEMLERFKNSAMSAITDNSFWSHTDGPAIIYLPLLMSNSVLIDAASVLIATTCRPNRVLSLQRRLPFFPPLPHSFNWNDISMSGSSDFCNRSSFQVVTKGTFQSLCQVFRRKVRLPGHPKHKAKRPGHNAMQLVLSFKNFWNPWRGFTLHWKLYAQRLMELVNEL